MKSDNFPIIYGGAEFIKSYEEAVEDFFKDTKIKEPKQMINKPYNKMNRRERRQHKRYLAANNMVDVDVLRVEGSKEQPIGLDDEGMLRFMADDYNRILGKEIWIVTEDNINALNSIKSSE